MTQFNPDFDRRILAINGPGLDAQQLTLVSTLYRGVIITDDSKYGVKFLYNPSQIVLQHTAEGADFQPPQGLTLPDGVDPGTNGLSPIGNLSFSLLFDRTYEMWSSANNNGVMEDVAAFYRICGMLDTPNATDLSPTKPMNLIACYFYFGQSGQSIKQRATRYPLYYYGWIQSLTVTYTHWTVNMIPSRCAIDVQATLVPAASANASSSASPVPAPSSNPGQPSVTLPGPGGGANSGGPAGG